MQILKPWHSALAASTPSAENSIRTYEETSSSDPCETSQLLARRVLISYARAWCAIISVLMLMPAFHLVIMYNVYSAERDLMLKRMSMVQQQQMQGSSDLRECQPGIDIVRAHESGEDLETGDVLFKWSLRRSVEPN